VTPKQLKELAQNLFAKRSTYMTLQQEIAEQFYPERADFTVRRDIGEDMASHLTTSFPPLCRRDLGDEIGTMLRPTNKAWFHMVPRNARAKSNTAQRWLQEAEIIQRRAMYDPDACFAKATKQGDHDFATFGGAVISAQLNRTREHMLFQAWHLKDVAWREDQDGKIDFKARQWRPAVQDLIRLFPRGKIDDKIKRKAQKDPFAEANIMHIVCEAELADVAANGRPRVSIFYDCENESAIEVVPVWGRIYLIPRWATVSGSQYPYSPATVIALPEGRLLQAMTLTMLEAGEKAVNPPLIATAGVVKSDMQQFPGGVTWVDMEYDEKLGAALRAMNIDVKGLPIGLEMVKDSREVLLRCFFANKLRAFNPNTDPQMTAFQAGQIVQEYIRGALPLFEPMEQEYNGQLCDETFDILFRAGAFGSPFDVPKELRGEDIDFGFESPLHDAIEQQKGLKFLEFKQIVAEAVALDPASVHIPDAVTILRDVAEGIKVPAKWLRSELQVQDAKRAAAEESAATAKLAQLQAGADVTATLGKASKDVAQAQSLQSR
jgi:hypothetical protein